MTPAAHAPAALDPSPWTMTDSLGELQAGRFQLREQIGRGGMGTVYLAFDARLGREVAIKMLESRALSDEQLRARFTREADIALSLDHPGIVRTHEIVKEPDGQLGIVMDYVAGKPLREKIPADPRVAVAIVSDLLDALEYLDARGMARIDFKPENIILADEHPVIVDLGLVKPWQHETRLTSTGVMVGTPAYMSPEQATGKPVDVRSDIFALGLVLFELISGEQAFQGEGPMAVLFRIVQDEADLSRLRCSEELRDVVARAISKSVADRFQSPAEMRAAFQATPEAAASS